ncbi:DgyrCDS14781 [Dimorphilus gyrociliatus]|uniref:DgyrCDS14781 n=1 Tax=Dimorphilus gyrociliatus TaxID=2664684 RepID=A0A7I8WEZ6_9ANNE|nr:DgyrCDS14781 [Dimorphilus gyrociliatus]
MLSTVCLLAQIFTVCQLATISEDNIYSCEKILHSKPVTSCWQCKEGSIPSKDKLTCLDCPEFCTNTGCLLDNQGKTICKSCKEHYYLKENTCFACSNGCKNCTSSSICLECYSNYAASDSTKECIKCPTNCNKCTWNFKTSLVECSSCNPLYTLKDTTCIACGSNCKSCTYSKDKGVSCSLCQNDSYKQVDSNNIATCKQCSSSIADCLKCSDKDTCTECLSKQYAITTSKKCEKCSSINDQCIECDASSGTNVCKKCKSGFYVKSGSCESCPRNCDTCSESGNVVKCTKCLREYIPIKAKICDRCPDNCQECEISNNKLVCKSGRCLPTYALDLNGLCSKCPSNCNVCSWSLSNSRTECSGSEKSHSCIESSSGNSWVKKNDGTCSACPNSCSKCHFETSDQTKTLCYPSKCHLGYGYDDETGNCVQCPSGCDYCKKRSTGVVCLKCNGKYAPKYSSISTIESCLPCSIQNCEYCEVINGEAQCLRSPCASKATSSQNKKYKFSTKTCDSDCPEDLACNTGMINDEHDICFCRSCPKGSVVILAGQSAGICASCGNGCEECVLNSDQTDIECKTCTVGQWVSVEIGGILKRGCYDCNQATLQCKTLELVGNVCRCKSGGCIGDQTDITKQTVLQEDSMSTYRKCKACSEQYPNGLWCSGKLTGSPAHALELCQYSYVENPASPNSCLEIQDSCIDWSNTEGASGKVTCSSCFSSHLTTGQCTPCTDNCVSCIVDGPSQYCLKCIDGMSGRNCAPGKATCTEKPPNCEEILQEKRGSVCECTKCLSGFAIKQFHALFGSAYRIGLECDPETTSSVIPGCHQKYNSPTGTICTRCTDNYVLDSDICQPGIPNCKASYSFYKDPAGGSSKVPGCKVAKPNYILTPGSTSSIIAVPTANQGGTACKGYVAASGSFAADKSRCGACTVGHVLDSGNAIKYECFPCSASNLDHCIFAVVSEGKCLCGRCRADTADKIYFKHPSQPGCIETSKITDCTTHSIRLKNGQYSVSCSQCSTGSVANDYFSCIPCTKLCTGGTKVGCICDCSAVGFVNSQQTDCISCLVASKPFCAEVELDNNICKCKKCNPNYALTADRSGCVSCQTGPGGATSNCEVCNLAVTSPLNEVIACTQCSSDYTILQSSSPATNPTCTKCHEGCSKCSADSSGNTKCTICKVGYILSNSGTCIQCPQSPAPCTECRLDPSDQTRAICLAFGCSTGAFRDADFTCESCTISDCEICIRNIEGNLKCLKCNKGNFLESSGSCQNCVAGCDFCLDATSCIPNGCKLGFTRHRTNGQCIPCSTDNSVARCSYKDAVNETLIPEECMKGYKLNTTQSPASCNSCSPNCENCEINGQGRCDSGNCKSGYFYNDDDQQCYEKRYGCLNSVRKNDQTVCTSCDLSTRVLVGNSCIFCPTGCNGCSYDFTIKKFTCSNCNSKYYKTDENLCSLCPEGCEDCSLSDGTVTCTKCLPKYGLKGSICSKCGYKECQSCEMISGSTTLVCSTCSNSYYLNDVECGQCPKFCQECSYNEEYKCSQCYDKYVLANDGKCLPCPSNCQTCIVDSTNTVKCTKCLSNEFSLQPTGICLSCSAATFPKCVTCSETPTNGQAICHSCEKGYNLLGNNKVCQSCEIDGCNQCIYGKVCESCKPGFNLHNFNRQCSRKCFECRGSLEDCGKDISNLQNSTDKIRLIDCGIGDCWAHRVSTNSLLTFERNCSIDICTSSTTNEHCKSVNGVTQCSKCCSGEKCNIWELDGKAGVERCASFSMFIIYTSFITFTYLLY